MTLHYTLQFFDYWHISSGLSGGSRLDSLVIKDSDGLSYVAGKIINGLPYVAGKIIKGLAREMAELLGDCAFVNSCFGGSSNDGKNGDDKDKCFDEKAKNIQGICYFTNATLEEKTAKQITTNKLHDNLYDIIASTKIDENGIAESKSLREIEVVIPLTLIGEIRDVPDEYKEKMTRALKMIKRMGLNRNRGLGRCAFTMEESK